MGLKPPTSEWLQLYYNSDDFTTQIIPLRKIGPGTPPVGCSVLWKSKNSPSKWENGAMGFCGFCRFCPESLETWKIAGWWFGTWLDYFPFSWECHHPNWLSLIFFRGVNFNHQPGMISTWSAHWAPQAIAFQIASRAMCLGLRWWVLGLHPTM